jgi:2-methylcitrate dehydratase PrpD
MIEWLHSLRFGDLPKDVVGQARRCLLDLIGVAAAGAQTELARIATGLSVAQFGDAHGPRLLFDGRRASLSGAAFAGANMLDSFDAHDGHALTKGHAGAAILPTVLALADTQRIDGAELLTLLVIGYEIAIRAGIALHGSAADYHTSGAWNALGCAAVCARALGLSEAQTRHALGIAEYHGPRSQMMRCIAYPTMVKDGSGWGTLAGVAAALLARDGFTGAPAVTLEDVQHDGLWRDLGSRWRIMELYFKPWPVCRWAHPAMTAAQALVQRHDIAPARIERIEVRTFAEAAALTVHVPKTTEEAQYSLPFPLAVLVVRGALDADAITGAGLAEPRVLSLAERVTLIADPALSARFPAERLAVVRMTLHDGTTLESEATAAPGDPDRPLSDAALIDKFHTLAASLTAERRERIVRAVAADDIAALLDAVLAPIHPQGD